MHNHQLTEDTFSFGYCNTGTGECFYVGADHYFIGGSLYKLPLNMLYTEMLRDGLADPDETISGLPYADVRQLTIQYSDNELSQILRKKIAPDVSDFRSAILKYGGLNPEALPENYYHKNLFSPRFMIHTLQYLHENQVLFSGIIDAMKQAHPGRYLKNRDSSYEIAHKYGFYEGQLNDAAIVYTPEPFFLVVFTRGVPEEVLGRFCSLMTDYTLASCAAAAQAQTQPQPEPAPEPAPEAPAARPHRLTAAALSAAGTVSLVLCIVLLRRLCR